MIECPNCHTITDDETCPKCDIILVGENKGKDSTTLTQSKKKKE